MAKTSTVTPISLFFHRSFIYRKAFLYMAVNCGKFENIDNEFETDSEGEDDE